MIYINPTLYISLNDSTLGFSEPKEKERSMESTLRGKLPDAFLLVWWSICIAF
jgi:hypothetical protein